MQPVDGDDDDEDGDDMMDTPGMSTEDEVSFFFACWMYCCCLARLLAIMYFIYACNILKQKSNIAFLDKNMYFFYHGK